MASDFIEGRTLDDVLRSVFELILTDGETVVASRGATKDVTGVLLHLSDPRARLSRTETRGKLFSCLGELCWYLHGSESLAHISYYLPHYEDSATGDRVEGAYGPRLFDWRSVRQVPRLLALLRSRPTTRRAVIQLYDATDPDASVKDVPCTCVLQFLIRGDRVHMMVYMRSQDAYWGLTHDVFAFTMLQEIVARTVGLELGSYKHFVGSLHLYEEQLESASRYLAEGWQSTTNPMPPMPEEDPWSSVAYLLSAEAALREGVEAPPAPSELAPYWADLVRVLQLFRLHKTRHASDDSWNDIKREMVSRVFDIHIGDKEK